jgi:hypothetical protein
MLKRKLLTAVLTATLVFGIGGVETDTFSVHQHELGIAHAAPEKLAKWMCHWCGIVDYSKSTVSEYGIGAREPRRTDKCRHNPIKGGDGLHGWIWVGGSEFRVEKFRTYYRCTRCKKISELRERGNLPDSSGCINNEKHLWGGTLIVKTW